MKAKPTSLAAELKSVPREPSFCPPELLLHASQLPPPELLERPTWIPATGPPGRQFPRLENITSPTVDTATAAHLLNRRPQTLRCWAMNQHPIRPLNINGRLAWPVSELRRLLQGAV
jgi:hypothetical protein